jgi:hypothetical protein
MMFHFPTKFVFTSSVSNHSEIKNNIKKFYENRLLKRSNPDSTLNDYDDDSGNLHQFLEEKSYLDQIVWKPIDQLISYGIPFSSSPKCSSINSIWANFYHPGDVHHAHSHTGSSTLSGIYIVELRGENTTWFHQDGPEGFEYLYRPENIKEGDVIIFPSNLVHYVSPSEHERITIAFNIFSEF